MTTEEIARDRLETVRKIRDIASLCGTAAWPKYVRKHLDELANQLEFLACGAPQACLADLPITERG